MFKTNRLLQAILLIAVTLLSGNINAQTTETLAFPGAEGFGRYVTGGRGGTVYHVTTLEDNTSEGSFRYAVKKSGTRTIVFDVSGTIHLTSELKLSNGNVTIAGQTAPGDGICIADYPFVLSANNVIIRFMRFRLGNKYVADHEGDGLGGMDKKNIIIDHCSVSWSIDECLSVYGNENQTVQWCIVSQSLVNAGHEKGAHGYGGNWGGSGATYHHNLLAHHTSRTPRLGPRYTTQEDERMDLRNNVIYNWAGNGCYGGEGMNVNIVNNYYKVGPGTETRSTTIQRRIAQIGVRTTSYIEKYPSYAPMLHVWGKFYVNGNVNSKFSDVTNDNWTYGIYNQTSNDSDVDNTYTQETKDTMKLDTPIPFEAVTTHSAEDAYEKVLDYAGCSLHRDWVDELIVSDTRNGVASYTGPTVKIAGMIDSQDDLKPADAGDDWSAWPELASEEAPLDTDGDGIPDDWEDANGLNKNDASDGSIVGEDGYTNLENYMNSIVADIMEKEVEGGVLMSGIETSEEDNSGNGNEDDGDVVTAEYEISSYNFSDEDETTNTWNFEDGFSISNQSGKNYSEGSDGCIKFSRGVQFTLNIPDNMKVTKIKIYGYDNYADTDAYLSELNSLTFDPTDYVFPAKVNNNAVFVEHEIELAYPAQGTMTFTPGGQQCAWKFTLTTSTSTGIKNVTVSNHSDNKIYNLQGMQVKSPLTKGIYISNGKKFVVK